MEATVVLIQIPLTIIFTMELTILFLIPQVNGTILQVYILVTKILELIVKDILPILHTHMIILQISILHCLLILHTCHIKILPIKILTLHLTMELLGILMNVINTIQIANGIKTNHPMIIFIHSFQN